MIHQLPPSLHRFFWEHDPGKIDICKHADYIMARIMERGSWQAMVWLRKTYSPETLAHFLAEKGWRFLPPREVNYWALVSGLPEKEKRALVKKALQKNSVWSRRYRVS